MRLLVAGMICCCMAGIMSFEPNYREHKLPEVGFKKHIQPILARYCGNCHFDSRKGVQASLETFQEVKEASATIVKRIKLKPGTPGFMPFGGKSITASQVRTIENWIKGGYKP